jgi:hypothetical protein
MRGDRRSSPLDNYDNANFACVTGVASRHRRCPPCQSMTCREGALGAPGNSDASAKPTSMTMAQRTVRFVIGQILTDEELRGRFLVRPAETLAPLRDRGYDLTNVEIDALTRTDPRLRTSGAE